MHGTDRLRAEGRINHALPSKILETRDEIAEYALDIRNSLRADPLDLRRGLRPGDRGLGSRVALDYS